MEASSNLKKIIHDTDSITIRKSQDDSDKRVTATHNDDTNQYQSHRLAEMLTELIKENNALKQNLTTDYV